MYEIRFCSGKKRAAFPVGFILGTECCTLAALSSLEEQDTNAVNQGCKRMQ